MKRSEVNAIIQKAIQFIDDNKFQLPPFAKWTPEDWQNKGHEYDEIRDNMLGWDITDYGLGRFYDVGLVLVTIRNGNRKDDAYEKTYAEKLLIIEEGQLCPMHFHWYKMEDIINRGGGNALIKVYNATEDEKLADTDVEISVDGRRMTVPAGSVIRLLPGESITLPKRQFHDFTAEKGFGPVMLGEVSMCNDDNMDNCFLDPLGRFPKIQEDELPIRLLCNEYPPAK